MKSKVDAYKKRRYDRLLSRIDAEDEKGRWITTENGHKVHLNEEGVPDKGNPHVIEKMNGGSSSGGTSFGGEKHSLNDKFNEALQSKNKYDVVESLPDYISEMKIGDTVECKDYKTGKVMKLQKMTDTDTVSAFKDLNGKNVMVSPEQVSNLLGNSIMYADYAPKFEDASGGTSSGEEENFKRPSVKEQDRMLHEAGYTGLNNATYQDFVDLYGEKGAYDYLIKAAENEKKYHKGISTAPYHATKPKRYRSF